MYFIIFKKLHLNTFHTLSSPHLKEHVKIATETTKKEKGQEKKKKEKEAVGKKKKKKSDFWFRFLSFSKNNFKALQNVMVWRVDLSL